MRVLQRPLSMAKSKQKTGRVWKNATKLPVFRIAKLTLALKPAPNVENQPCIQLSSRNLGQMCSQSPPVPFHPELFQVKSKC